MNYGLYVSAAGAISSMHRQDVLANNLANINTPGFKPDLALTRQRLPEPVAGPVGNIKPQQMLERLGGGILADPTRVRFAQGVIAQTGRPLDLAIEGGGFFVGSADDGSMSERVRYTRDGRMTINAEGELRFVATGMRVLDANNRPIRLDRRAQVLIESDGSIVQNGAVVARLQISPGAEDGRMIKTGDTMFKAADPSSRFVPRAELSPPGRVIQGATEASAVDPVMAMNDMINASRAVSANITMMQYHDNLLGQVINTYARVT